MKIKINSRQKWINIKMSHIFPLNFKISTNYILNYDNHFLFNTPSHSRIKMIQWCLNFKVLINASQLCPIHPTIVQKRNTSTSQYNVSWSRGWIWNRTDKQLECVVAVLPTKLASFLCNTLFGFCRWHCQLRTMYLMQTTAMVHDMLCDWLLTSTSQVSMSHGYCYGYMSCFSSCWIQW